MVAANLFEGMVTENPYRHIRNFTTICNMVRQEGVPDEWFKWNHFPYSLAGNAKTWYSFASFEVEGNWNKLTKKFCEKFFPISKLVDVAFIDLGVDDNHGQDGPSNVEVSF
jgi:hypothetical protein